MQVKPYDGDGARGKRESEEEGEEAGGRGDDATGDLGQIHLPYQTSGDKSLILSFFSSLIHVGIQPQEV